MLEWYTKVPPIKLKLLIAFCILASLTAICLITVVAQYFYVEQYLTTDVPPAVRGAVSFSLFWSLATYLACSMVGLGISLLLGKAISDPYVATVERMESLAQGDLDAPVRFTDHQDCVGRMTRAMSVFRDHAQRVNEAAVSQKAIVAVMEEALGRLADNDLNHQIDTPLPPEYEQLRLDFNRAVSALRNTISGVAEAASDIRTASGEIRTASGDLAMRTEQQASAIEQSTSTLNSINTSVQATAGNANAVAEMAAKTYREADGGGDVLRRAINAMAEISQSSQQIGQIVGVIDGIAFQTNLLALNAGVEAARAGDSGRGFAVVANEVRALAQRSANAAQEIKELIATSTRQVDEGSALVNEAGEALLHIVGSIGAVQNSIEEISKAVGEQATDLRQVNGAITHLEQSTQQNAAMVEESTAAAGSLADRAGRLASLVGVFHLQDHASQSYGNARRRAA